MGRQATSSVRLPVFVSTVIILCLAAFPSSAQRLKDASGRNPIPELPAERLDDAAVVTQGQEIWQDQCAHCHGSKAYPGKAPKLTPRRYTPAFVFDRVTYGFRKMPPWEDVYSEDERVSVVAWVMSRKFSP